MPTLAATTLSSKTKSAPKRADAKQRKEEVLYARSVLAGRLPSQMEAMQRKLEEMQSELEAMRPYRAPEIILPELHDVNSGRIDAAKVAEFMGVALKALAEGVGLNYKAVHRHPSASGFQAALRPVKRVLELLHEFFGPPESIRIWLNTPHPDLAGATSLDTILAGKASAVALLLENARNGVPS